MTKQIEEVAFPTFDREQLEFIEAIAERVHFEDADVLVQQGTKDYPFFIINRGHVRIVERDELGERLIARHGPLGFIGDIDILTGRSAIFSAIAEGHVDAFRLPAAAFRKLLSECTDASDLLLEAFQMRRRLLSQTGFVGVLLVGNANESGTARLREFFYKNHVPCSFIEADSDPGREQLRRLDAEHLPLPLVRCNGQTLSQPSLLRLAKCIGISRDVDGQHVDLAIVGSGPAGLAAAVYASSEGIRTLVIDRVGPGGQAASSSKIENFIGFPSGLSGRDLAERGYLQALKFGAQFIAPVGVESIEPGNGEHELFLDSGQRVHARCVLVASGVSYRQLDLPGCEQFEGAGVYYAATQVEARVCEGETAVVVGGGNSAGQAAMFLADRAKSVYILIRGHDLSKSMSAYLCSRISKHPRIQVMEHTEVQQVHGQECVQSVTLRNNQTEELTELDCRGLFIFIGARPHTSWLPKQVVLDEKGFVLTGSALDSHMAGHNSWPLERPPCDLETSMPGIMAAGDVRSGTTKRCGFAVGDGSLAIACVHRYLSGLA